jgi:hypothetical protein
MLVSPGENQLALIKCLYALIFVCLDADKKVYLRASRIWHQLKSMESGDSSIKKNIVIS